MSTHNSRLQIVHRRAELMAELLLQEFDPEFISRPTSPDVGYDLLVGFTNKRSGINTFAVEVKATERPPAGHFQITRHTFERFANSNIPGLLLVADVKQNELHFAWLSARRMSGSTASVSIPLLRLDEENKSSLRERLHAAEAGVAVAG